MIFYSGKINFLRICQKLTFAAYIQQTLRLSEYPFAPQNLGFGFWAIMVSFLLRCLIWTMVSCCPAGQSTCLKIKIRVLGCRPCLTINGEKLEELQAEAILNLGSIFHPKNNNHKFLFSEGHRRRCNNSQRRIRDVLEKSVALIITCGNNWNKSHYWKYFFIKFFINKIFFFD